MQRQIHPRVLGSLYKGEAVLLKLLVSLADETRVFEVPDGDILLDILNPKMMYERQTINTYVWNLRKKGYITVGYNETMRGMPINWVRVSRSAFVAPAPSGPTISEIAAQADEAERVLTALLPK